MVTKEQFMNGLLMYADKEIIPHLPTVGKWGIGAAIILATSKGEELLDNLENNSVVQALSIVDENGKIDVDILANALKESADKYGKMQMTIPVIGTLAFTSDDIEKMRYYIEDGE